MIAVKYFSARPDDIEQSRRQNAFFQANKENPKFRLILGKYLKKEITCFKCGNVIHTHEEKETDVRIATQIVADAYQKNCDVAIVISTDSDMIPAIELATQANADERYGGEHDGYANQHSPGRVRLFEEDQQRAVEDGDPHDGGVVAVGDAGDEEGSLFVAKRKYRST